MYKLIEAPSDVSQLNISGIYTDVKMINTKSLLPIVKTNIRL